MNCCNSILDVWNCCSCMNCCRCLNCCRLWYVLPHVSFGLFELTIVTVINCVEMGGICAVFNSPLIHLIYWPVALLTTRYTVMICGIQEVPGALYLAMERLWVMWNLWTQKLLSLLQLIAPSSYGILTNPATVGYLPMLAVWPSLVTPMRRLYSSTFIFCFGKFSFLPHNSYRFSYLTPKVSYLHT